LYYGLESTKTLICFDCAAGPVKMKRCVFKKNPEKSGKIRKIIIRKNPEKSGKIPGL
jgi:hypothetical protein